MSEKDAYGWYNSQPAKDLSSTVGKTPVDGRMGGVQFTLCQTAGNHLFPDGKSYCKYYLKSMYRSCCMHYRDNIEDYSKPNTYAEQPTLMCVCDFKEKEVKDEQK